MTKPAPYRWGLIYAATWRIITELTRRHGDALGLHVFQLHPGLSGDGIFVLTSLSRWQDRGEGGSVEFCLGGGERGLFHVRHRYDGLPVRSDSNPHEGVDYVDAYVRATDPVAVINDLERDAGLPARYTIPTSSPRDVTYRVIAELLERRALARPEFLVASGYVDSSSGSHIEAWAKEAPWAARETTNIVDHDFRSMAAVGEHFFMLHPVGMWNPPPDTDGLIVFDAKVGEAWRPGRYAQRVQLMELYQKAGRTLGPVVDRVDAHSRA